MDAKQQSLHRRLGGWVAFESYDNVVSRFLDEESISCIEESRRDQRDSTLSYQIEAAHLHQGAGRRQLPSRIPFQQIAQDSGSCAQLALERAKRVRSRLLQLGDSKGCRQMKKITSSPAGS